MTLHNETTAAADLQRPAYVLSDEALLSLSEYTPYSEGDNWLWFVEDGKPVGGFWSIAEEVARATAADAVQISSGQGRALLAMRAFYFLGVLRGGEAYRRLVAPEDEGEKLPDLICLSKWIQSFSRRIWKPCRRSGWPVYWPSWGLLCPGRRRI